MNERIAQSSTKARTGKSSPMNEQEYLSKETVETLQGLEVTTDSDLSPAEKETTITAPNDRDYFRIHSDIPVHIKWVLSLYPNVQIRGFRTKNGSLVDIRANIPKGYLKLQGSNRKQQTNGAMVTKP